MTNYDELTQSLRTNKESAQKLHEHWAKSSEAMESQPFEGLKEDLELLKAAHEQWLKLRETINISPETLRHLNILLAMPEYILRPMTGEEFKEFWDAEYNKAAKKYDALQGGQS